MTAAGDDSCSATARIDVTLLSADFAACLNKDIKECDMSAEFVTVGKAADVPVGTIAAFDIKGERIAVANVRGTFYAFDDTCTHEFCSLAEGELEDATVICPCHQGEFDVRTGEVLALPPPSPVKTYQVRTEGGDLQIAV
jgi:3-phenylpropionate/trans-cinnamate dioxygenase ferredoxin component